MKKNALNLAARPFSNQGPVLRVAVMLAVAAVALLVVNVTSYRSYFSGAGQEAREELRALDKRVATLNKELTRLQGRLAKYDLETLNRQVEFLNARIRERTFGWSRLFDDLATVLPVEVRLERLTPRFGRGRANASAAGGGDVHLTLQGFARSDEALLELIDALFTHERFRNPSPSRESRDDGQLRFTLSVTYRPLTASQAARVRAEEGEA